MSIKLVTYPFLFTVNPLHQINTTTINERLSRVPHQLFKPHRTDFFQIYLFTQGFGSHMVDFEPIEVKPQHILFISQGQVHAFDANQGYDGKALIFTEEFFCRTSADQQFFQSSPLFKNFFCQSYFKINENFEKLEAIFSEIFDELKRVPDKKQGDILHNLLHRIILLADREMKENSGVVKHTSHKEDLAIRFKEEIDKHYLTHKKLIFYIDLLHVSLRQLQIATNAMFNKSPKQLVQDRILLEAKRMLAYDKLSVKEIAAKLGFDETTNFIKYFKKNSGLTPLDFRRKFLE
ncbi:AraC family transcriptional regulator [Sphingobacterium sp. lm-10]|uniref:AraC family transcriptional regulator n=1 Tax=Sphingobacterium sp. lm-10 TaxID=2944904 RepID=UPI0020201161|nr:helix-turn-helix domain-containing protein [Sphingobacterium sp. lm-10]MCL7988740.1 AraC family transcriptional regulator [Sphingobacterium sp. lm-10]